MEPSPALPCLGLSAHSVDSAQTWASHSAISVRPGVSSTVHHRRGSSENRCAAVPDQKKRFSHNPYVQNLVRKEAGLGSSTVKRKVIPSANGSQISPFLHERGRNSGISIASFSPQESPGLTARASGAFDESENCAAFVSPSTANTPQHMGIRSSLKEYFLPEFSLDSPGPIPMDGEQAMDSRVRGEHFVVSQTGESHSKNPSGSRVSVPWKAGAAHAQGNAVSKGMRFSKMLPPPLRYDFCLCVLREGGDKYPEVTLFCIIQRWYQEIEREQKKFTLRPGGCTRRKHTMELDDWCPIIPQSTPNKSENRDWAIRCEKWWQAEFGNVEKRTTGGRSRHTNGNYNNRSGI